MATSTSSLMDFGSTELNEALQSMVKWMIDRESVTRSNTKNMFNAPMNNSSSTSIGGPCEDAKTTYYIDYNPYKQKYEWYSRGKKGECESTSVNCVHSVDDDKFLKFYVCPVADPVLSEAIVTRIFTYILSNQTSLFSQYVNCTFAQDVATHKHYPVLCTKYLPGVQSLASLIKRAGKNFSTTHTLFIKVAHLMQYMKVVSNAFLFSHNDLHFGNIVESQDVLYLIDYGRVWLHSFHQDTRAEFQQIALDTASELCATDVLPTCDAITLDLAFDKSLLNFQIRHDRADLCDQASLALKLVLQTTDFRWPEWLHLVRQDGDARLVMPKDAIMQSLATYMTVEGNSRSNAFGFATHLTPVYDGLAWLALCLDAYWQLYDGTTSDVDRDISLSRLHSSVLYSNGVMDARCQYTLISVVQQTWEQIHGPGTWKRVHGGGNATMHTRRPPMEPHMLQLRPVALDAADAARMLEQGERTIPLSEALQPERVRMLVQLATASSDYCSRRRMQRGSNNTRQCVISSVPKEMTDKLTTITTTLLAVVDDRLKPTSALCTDRAPTKFPASGKLRVLALKALKTSKKDIGHLLSFIDIKCKTKYFFGLFSRDATTRVPVKLVDMKHAFNSKNQLAVTLRWQVDSLPAGVKRPTVKQVRDALSGQLTDGWGEGVEQRSRFGPIVDSDDGNEFKLVPKAAIKKSMQAHEDGQYALLYTLRDAKIVLK